LTQLLFFGCGGNEVTCVACPSSGHLEIQNRRDRRFECIVESLSHPRKKKDDILKDIEEWRTEMHHLAAQYGFTHFFGYKYKSKDR
jgi:hypothetical protein